ncbi:MAG TPA: flagellar hook-associated protein FlgL [Firmicutes bacterium]|nr:flagellar hook-associated protein FlgL [Bacillota bacterium]
MRVTNKMLVTNSLSNLNRGLERLQYLSSRLASGKKLMFPSDDPIGTGSVLRMYKGLEETRQYVANNDYGIGMLTAIDGALTDLTSILQRARELAVYGANGTLPEDSLYALAREINELIDHAVQVANSTYAGIYIFGGQETSKPPYSAVVAPEDGTNIEKVESIFSTYTDAKGITVEVGPSSELEISLPGSVIFDGDSGVFEVLIDLRRRLDAGDSEGVSSESIAKLDAVISQVLRYQAEVGAKTKRLETTKSRLEGLDINLQTLISKTEDIDVAEAIMHFKMQENAYRLALDTTARIIQPTLMDFLR